MEQLAQRLHTFNNLIGRGVSWLTLAMVLVTFLVVVLRYAFDLGWIWLQESVTYMHALVFMLGAAYTLGENEHVRVDILYNRFTDRGRAWVNCLGIVFLLVPFCSLILFTSWDYVESAWAVTEGSPQAGGLDGVYLLKTIILVMPVLLLLQGLAHFLQQLAVLTSPKAEEN
ncbi:MAG: TRAP transporter small permease subunit [Immundisolibacteraceae bacterium]|nr:TRAP transporter small permease subunit [Immundisolibacteraceae bacterium]